LKAGSEFWFIVEMSTFVKPQSISAVTITNIWQARIARMCRKLYHLCLLRIQKLCKITINKRPLLYILIEVLGVVEES
jgi:hypothetical protein